MFVLIGSSGKSFPSLNTTINNQNINSNTHLKNAGFDQSNVIIFLIVLIIPIVMALIIMIVYKRRLNSKANESFNKKGFVKIAQTSDNEEENDFDKQFENFHLSSFLENNN